MKDSEACLWTLKQVFEVGHRLQQSMSSSKRTKKTMDVMPFGLLVPDTLIYENGAPRQWMKYNEHTKMVEFRLIDANDPKCLLDAVLNMNNCFRNCLVWYASGTCEELSVSYLFEVFSSLEWQRQILCIQAYIDPATSINNGFVNSAIVRLDYPLFSMTATKDERKALETFVEWINTNNQEEYKIDALTWSMSMDEECRYWLRFVDSVKYSRNWDAIKRKQQEEAATKALKESVVEGGLLMSQNPSSSSSTTTTTEKRESSISSQQSIDDEFDSYYQLYCSTPSTDQIKMDVVLVHDIFGVDKMEELCKQCGDEENVRVVSVSLIKRGNNPRPAARPPGNVLLSNWLQKLLLRLGIGVLSGRKWILCGIGVGANVACHLAAYRSVENLQAVVSINGFAYVDRALYRKLRHLGETATNPASSQIINQMRNGFLDLRSSLALIKTPMIIIQSTLNEIILPLHVEAIASARGAPRTISSSISDCVRYQGQLRSHIIWLKATHDIIVERFDFMHNVIFQVTSSLDAVNRPAEAAPEQEEKEVESEGENEDNQSILPQVKEDADEQEQHHVEEEEEGRRNGAGLFGGIVDLMKSTKRKPGVNKQRKSKKKLSKKQREELAAQEEHERLLRQKLEEEEERKRQLEEQARRVRELKELKRLEFERNKPTEAEERDMMMDQDVFSKELRRVFLEEQKWNEQQELVRRRMEELREAREREDARAKEYAEKERERKRVLEYERRRLEQFGDLLDEDGNPLVEDGVNEDDQDLKKSPHARNTTLNVLGSSVSGASKIRLDFLKVAQRQALNIERSTHLLEVIRETQASKDSNVKRVGEYDRAINILRGAAYIKNPSQVSRKKRRAAEQAAEELVEVSTAREETQNLVNSMITKLKELNTEIGKVNSAIQSDSIIISKKLHEMEDMVVKLNKLIQDIEREKVELRKSRQLAIERRTQLATTCDVAQRRLQDLEDELERVKQIRTKYCDSSIWQAGVLQRIKTVELINYLEKERTSLMNRLGALDNGLKVQQDAIDQAENRLAAALRERGALYTQLKLINSGLELHKSGEIKTRAAADFKMHQLETEKVTELVKAEGKEENHQSGDQDHHGFFATKTDSVAAAVRAKPSNLRSRQEREWIALDMVINRYANFYSDAQLHNYKQYRPSELTEDVIDCLYELPEEINLAMPFIRTKAQLDAYQLIQKYSFGNDPNEVARMDRLAATNRRRGDKDYRIFGSIEEYKLCLQEEGKTEESQDKTAVLLTEPEWKRLYIVEEQKLKAREGRVHTFHIPKDLLVQQIVAHIVFEGGFDDRGYVLGRLSAAMYYQEDVPIGYCSRKHDFQLCTESSMGKLTLIHDPNESGVPIAPGKYQIVVGSASLTRYSISIMAQTCRPLLQVEEEARMELFDIIDRLDQIEKDSEHLTISMYLSERKGSLVEKMVLEAERKCEEIEFEMSRITSIIEKRQSRLEDPYNSQHNDDYDSDDEEMKKATPARLAKLEIELDKWVQRASSRRAELYDTRKGTAEMAKLKREFKEEKETKAARLESLKHHNVITEDEVLETRNKVDRLNKERETIVQNPDGQHHQQEQEQDDELLLEQENAQECWENISHVLQGLETFQENNNATTMKTCCREDLLALLCAAPGTLKGPKAIALQRLMMKNIHPIERDCVETPMVHEPRGRLRQRLHFQIKGPEVITDIDEKSRSVLAELERANAWKDPFMDSFVLHGTKQRFPTSVLRKELNRELDRILTLQVREQEIFMLRELKEKYNANREVKEDDPFIDSSDEEENDEQEKGMAGDNGVDEQPKLSEPDRFFNVAKEEEPYCSACRARPCTWSPTTDAVALQERLIELREELTMVRHIDPSIRFVESKVSKSVKLGGKPRMLREDVLKELSTELSQLELKRRLLVVDEELHRAYGTKDQFMETSALHGYKQVQWTKNVISALENERERLIGREAVVDLVDDVLQHMLEGWIFGELEPDVGNGKKDMSSKDYLNEEEQVDNVESGKKGGVRKLRPDDKWIQISESLLDRRKRKAAVEMKEDVKHQLDETETVLKFGLFSLTLMYFRAMTLLKRSKFQGADEKRKSRMEDITSEKQRMQRSKTRAEARKRAMERAMGKARAGEQKRLDMLETRRLQEQEKLRKRVRKAHLEGHAAKQIQKVFRGHLGRHAARKWALRRLEEIAQQNLEYAAATAIQRVFRGYQGRLIAEDKKAELAEFIAQVRAEEAKEEEEEYWRRNPVKRFLRDVKRVFSSGSGTKNLDDLDDALYNPEPARNF